MTEPADPASAELVVWDTSGDLFTRLRTLELGAALWRTLRSPAELPRSTVILVASDSEPPWDRISEWSRDYRTIIATSRAKDNDELHALHIGAFGYIDTTMPSDGLRRTLQGALRGESAFRRHALGTWLRDTSSKQRSHVQSARRGNLTKRQREIVGLIATGATDKQIASRLGIRTSTAQKHVSNILRRLGVANRAAAVGMFVTSTPSDA